MGHRLHGIPALKTSHKEAALSTTPEDGRAGGIQVIARAADIMRLLQENPAGLSQVEISDRLGLAKSTVSRILLALETEHLITSIGTRGPYRLGVAVVKMAASIRKAVVLEITPFLTELAKQTDETVVLGFLENASVTFTHQVESTQRLRVVGPVGQSLPVYSCASGKALLSTQHPGYISERLPASFSPLTPHTLTTPAALRAEVDAARATGVAFDREENLIGASGIATALGILRDVESDRMAISITAPTQRFEGREEELAARLRTCAARINAALGR
ncbi:MAG: IclR family transcriptional regulator [Gordonia sp. (in: high G+C Gram-positive bacteria)]